MNYLKVYGYTGKAANNLKIAHRINRKLRATEKLGICTLIDWSKVEELNCDFVLCLARDLNPDKTCLGNLAFKWQAILPAGFSLPPDRPNRV